MQFLSFPFDWIAPTYGHPGWDNDLKQRTDLICAEFKDWLRPEDFSFHGPHFNGKDKYFNDRLGLIFLHDFPTGTSFETYFPILIEKYHRRCARLLKLIRNSKRILIVRVERPDLNYHTPLEDCRYARRTLSEHFAPVHFDFVLLQEDAALAPGECREEEIEDGLLILSLDYRNRDPGADIMQPNFSITSTALQKRFKVNDYRTRDERADYKHKQKMKHYAQYGATNALQYRWHKLKAALIGKMKKANR